jgi:hypothetical protein
VRQRAGEAVEIAARTDFKGFDFLTTDVQGLDQYTLLPAVIWMIKDLAAREESVARADARTNEAKALEDLLPVIAGIQGWEIGTDIVNGKGVSNGAESSLSVRDEGEQ